MWALQGNGNSIPSGIRYDPAAKPLVIGMTYTIAVGIRYSDIDFYILRADWLQDIRSVMVSSLNSSL
jgi:hypothetical protein